MGLLRKIFGTKNDRTIKRLTQIVSKVNELESKYSAFSSIEDLKREADGFKERLAKGESVSELTPDIFALGREASKRVLGMRHFDVQIIGGLALTEGKIAEMKTGEGKTLTATLPLLLHGLTGKGCHLVTVNDYLAKRDSEWMGKLYGSLGLSTGLIVHGLSDTERRAAYACDITYGTNNELGFDYLRDNMKTERERLVQRGHNFCIVDEVDSILIDEARTPLIISGPTATRTEVYYEVNAAIPGLHKDSDYIMDEKSHTVTLTEDGIAKVEKRLRVENLYDPKNIEYLHHTQQALKAHVLFKKDVDYVVRDNKVVIVDEHTGRLMPGRRYSDGLHGALEAKEHLKVENENQTLATVTFQNYFRLYKVLSGMTGTADTEAVEFNKIYNLDVVVIPTNRSMTRIDNNDIIYRTAREKFNVIADEIAARQKKGQPVLVGTVSVEKSELLASMLTKRGIPHEILNAKNHAREASIIQHAGEKGQVTISTNMAGRGTDIVLGAGVKDLGGLCVIGTERHESRRIDNQLRGRSGRQGDPGESIFYLSLEDDLMRIFASDRLSNIMQRLGMQEGESIVSPMVTRAIERAQKRVEEQNFSSRKHLLEYDDVMNQQRQVVYAKRRTLLQEEGQVDFIEDVVAEIAFQLAKKRSPEATGEKDWHLEGFLEDCNNEFSQIQLSASDFQAPPSAEALSDFVKEKVMESYKRKEEMVSSEVMRRVETFVYMQIIDQAWKDHLLRMDQLKDSVGLRGYAQKDPLQEYKKEAYNLFESMMIRIEDETTLALVRMPPPENAPTRPVGLDVDDKRIEMSHPDANPPSSKTAKNHDTIVGDGAAIHRTGRGESTQKAQQQVVKPVVREAPKVGRNDDCPCGSGKKYKKCHGKPAGEA